MNHKKTSGFTLLELAIVLVIIGLLVGSVLGGQELLHSAVINNFVKDVSKIDAATQTFKTKYQYLPGDMPDATTQWGIQAGATGNDDTCYTSPSSTAATCNGNGDGLIVGGWTGTGYHERGRYWQHLANAGLISGQFTGAQGLFASETRVGGINVMAGAISGTGYNIGYISPLAADANYFVHDPQHVLTNTGDFTAGATPNRFILTPTELLSIDQKIDDGKPGLGTVRGVKMGGVTPNCTTTTDPVTAMYATNLTSKECFLYVLMKF